MKKVFLYMLLAAGAFSVQSCLHDNEDVFDTPAAQRIEEVVAADKALLESATNGWKFEYYLGDDYVYGGLNYFVKFQDGKAYVSGENGGPGVVASSSYDVIADMGPVLTFNTYNEVFHYYAQPESNQVEGYQGDFEFVIMKTTNDSIYLQGKKWGNKMLMTRMADDFSADDYLEKTAQLADAINFLDYKADVNGENVTLSLDTDYSWMYYTTKDGEEISMPYIYTPTGLKLREPIEVNGVSMQFFNFTYDADNQWITNNESNIKFTGVPIEGWHTYDSYVGTYDLAYARGTLRVKLVPTGDKTTYRLEGLSAKFSPIVTYSKKTGQPTMYAQKVGDGDGFQAWMAVWDTAQGYLSWGTSYGMILRPNEDVSVLTFRNNEQWPGYVISGFLMWRMAADGSASLGNMNAATYNTWWINGSPQFARPTTMTRVSE